MENVAFITGITGQDGSLLAEFLLQKGYEVHGLVRWDSEPINLQISKLNEAYHNLNLHYGDMNDAMNLARLLKETNPTELYNLASLSHVSVSFDTPGSAFEVNANGTLNLLESIRVLDMQGRVRMYQASSSEMFGTAPAPQSEETAFEPCSPYAAAKLAAYWLARTYREAYGVHVSNGILFNHESPLRGEDFVTRKITKAVAAIEAGLQDHLALGNLDSMRDWGHAQDYIEGMWMMLQREEPGDYVLATGEAHSVREFVQHAFAHIGSTIIWEGEGTEETGRDSKTGKVLVRVDKEFFRPTDVNYLLGDATKARKVLGWQPKVSFETLVQDMVNADRQQYWKDKTWAKMAG